MQPSAAPLRSSSSFGPLAQVALLVLLTTLAIAATFRAGWWSQPVFVSDASQLSFFLYVGGAFVVGFGLLLARIRFIWIPAILLVAYVQFTGLGPGLSVLWFWICASLIGSTAAQLAGVAEPDQFTLRNAILGFAVIGTVIGIVAHFPCNYPWVYFVAISGAALFALRGRSLALPTVSARTFLRAGAEPLSQLLVQALIAAELALILATILLPEVGHDALSMHLNIPARMLSDGRWGFDVTTYVWSVMPFGADWLYTPPYFLGGEAAVRLFNASCLIATAAHVHGMLKDRFGKLVAATGPALLLSLPLCYLEIGSVFIDAPLALFFSLVLGELLGDASGPRRLLPLAVIIGFACAIKLNSVLILPFLLIWLIYTSRSRPVPWTQILAAVGIFAIFSAEPYVLALVKTGNPVFPFFNALFKSPYFETTSFTNPLYLRSFGPRLLYDAVMHSKEFGEFGGAGAIGIAFLVLIPLAAITAFVLRREWVLWTIATSILYILLVFKSQAYLRYVLPVMPWLIISASSAFSRIARPTIIVPVFTILLAGFAIARYPIAYWPFQQFDLVATFTAGGQAAFVERTKPEIIVAKAIGLRSDLTRNKILLLGIDPQFSQFPSGTISDSWHSGANFPLVGPKLAASTLKSLSADWKYASQKDLDFLARVVSSGAELIVFPVGRGFKEERIIPKFTLPELQINDVHVRRVDPDILYSVELLNNPDFDDGLHGWISDSTNNTSAGVQATVDHPIVQTVEIGGLQKLLMTMIVSCQQGGKFRTQINWTDKKGAFLTTDIAIHECAGSQTEVKRVMIVPPGAFKGDVFGGSHTVSPIRLLKLSVRGRAKRDEVVKP